MKKAYSKPEIVFESFTLSTNIAGDCETKTSNPNNKECGYQPEGASYTIFVVGITGCDRKVNDDGSNGFCYHVPLDNMELFNS